MEVENLFVPKDMCPLDFLADLGERIKNVKLLFHGNVFNKLIHSQGVSHEEISKDLYELTWEATEDYPETKLTINLDLGEWHTVYSISADDIAFEKLPVNPESTIRLKMAA